MNPEYAREMRLERVSLEEAYERMRSTYDRLAAENAELLSRIDTACTMLEKHGKTCEEVEAELAAANATLDALREAVHPDERRSWSALDAVHAILYPQPAALAEEKTNNG